MKTHLARDPDDPALQDESESADTYCGRFVPVTHVTTDFDKADCRSCSNAEEQKRPLGVRLAEVRGCDDCPLLGEVTEHWKECHHPGAPEDQDPEPGRLPGSPVWCPLRLTPLQIKKAG